MLLLVILGCVTTSSKSDDTPVDSVGDDCVDPVADYVDADGDGWGAGEPSYTCTPTGADRGGDCDDTRGDVNPGAVEVCDDADVDEDCDGSGDESGADGEVAWYVDRDGDGYGVEKAGVGCDPPAGSAPVGGDCDDTDPTATPADLDGDGLSTCDGDCDDDDAWVGAECQYTSMVGVLHIAAVLCDFELTGVALPRGSCAGCAFAFDAVATLSSGECNPGFEGTFGYHPDDTALSIVFYDIHDAGSFSAVLTEGESFDTLSFAGPSLGGYDYYGWLHLY